MKMDVPGLNEVIFRLEASRRTIPFKSNQNPAFQADDFTSVMKSSWRILTPGSRLQETRREKKARYSDSQSWGLMSGKLRSKK